MNPLLTSLGSAGFAVGLLAVADNVLGLPIGTSWWDGFIIGFGINVVMGSAVSSMVEPDEKSSKLYIFLFRYGHLLFNRSTSYFAHSHFWGQFIRSPAARTRLADPEVIEEDIVKMR